MVGYFINPLALRVDLSGDPTFRELLRRARETTIDAFEYADVPYEMVVNATNPERDLSQTPVFQAMMVLHNPAWQTDRPKFQPRGTTATEVVHEKGWSKFDVLLGMSERQNGLNTTWEYSTELFEDSTIKRMMSHFRQLIASAVDDPDRPLSRLSLLTPDERSKILVDWAGAGRARSRRAVRSRSCSRRRLQRTPDATAVVFEGREPLVRRAQPAREPARPRPARARRRSRTTSSASSWRSRSSWSSAVLARHQVRRRLCPDRPAVSRRTAIEFMLEDAEPAVVIATEHRRDAAVPAPAARSLVLGAERARR